MEMPSSFELVAGQSKRSLVPGSAESSQHLLQFPLPTKVIENEKQNIKMKSKAKKKKMLQEDFQHPKLSVTM